ncbi:TIGR02680 family protein [Streptomyces sp. DSM 44917]|uniref:TIGR02680 family protein n=1 Tax=Streptomyces boetiae TaxID=3075541 RepID=A0ABU2LF21_9ACTN|nr:TIGR02680 family protein [Streptomyces sp. DSM 44917]MDT0310188.1 TIGR02680 family protein [Streptomyces sp. DSM 44917]
MTALPAPAPGRWRPLRIGLVDLFYYDVEEFWFRDGRLLLRGNNGTGKSKVLALTLPFLLDGDLSARRVEPDGDPGKRMEWNLLLGGEHPHPERLGYAWIEFGRLDPATGRSHCRTLACGLKAVAGRGIARHWFAVTDQRIGEDLNLLDATGTALSRDRLSDAVAGRGRVYDQARAYRRAVDEALFGLGETRYQALVDLLIQLRQPQLSKRPSEAALSRALTEALPPMDQAVIADVAEAFRSLDEEKDQLREATEAQRAASRFLDHYRRYARIAARRRARLPRSRHARYEQLQRDLAQAQAAQREADQDRTAAEEGITALDDRVARLRAQDDALREGPEMRSARELERAAAEADRTAQERRRAEGDRDEAARLYARAGERAGRAEQRLADARLRLADALSGERRAARAARLSGELLPGGETSADRVPSAEGTTEAALRGRAEDILERGRRAVGHVEELAGRAERSAAERQAAGRRLDEAEAEVTHTAQRQAEAEQAASDAGTRLLEQVRDHLAGCAELRPADPAGLLDRLQDWVTHLNGPNPALAAASEAHRAAGAVLADRLAVLARRQEELRERTDVARRSLAALESGGQSGPQTPYTRTPGARDRRPGAPLWRLVDFRGHVPGADRAALEAALEASGLLDAWVSPDGTALATALDPGGHDILLVPDRTGPAARPSLADALCPAVDHGDPRSAAVGEAAVGRLLATIGLGAGEATGTWVAADGRFRIGALTGSWAKPAAEYVGEGAREEARRARMTALREDIAAAEAEREHLAAEQAFIGERRRALDAELAALPDDAGLRHAHALAAAAADAAHRARSRRDERAAELAQAAEKAAEAAAGLAETAADLGLPADREGLAAVRQALADYAVTLAALWPALRERDADERSAAERRAEAEEAATRMATLEERVGGAIRAATTAAERHATLRSTVGAAVAELERRLTETAEAMRAADRELRGARDALSAAGRRAGRAEGLIDRLRTDIEDAVAARAEAITALQRFAATGLLAAALPELSIPDPHGEPWAATPSIALARAIEADLSGTDHSDGAWERVQKHLSEEFTTLQNALSRHGHTASARMTEEGMVVHVVYQGRTRAVAELTEALAAEAGELTRILSAHEREILETHLLTEVAGTLHELLGAAERQVRAMNSELEERPTSTGMKLRLVWRLSRKAPGGLAPARERLRQSIDAWSPQDREAVGAFLQARIEQQRGEDESGSRLDHLTAALDYRGWHEFGIERYQHGRWVPATGPASGGERVLAASVPLFAAASSHYATAASPHCPRLVTLDEAFAGVDDDSRAKCLGLLHAFDLDVVMTSEREWACYPQVPGIAIAQLSRVDELAAVLVTRWEWDGVTRTPARETPPSPEPLWT